MDKVVSVLDGCPNEKAFASPQEYDAALASFCQTLSGCTPKVKDVLLRQPLEMLAQISPQHNSLGYLWVLDLILSPTQTDVSPPAKTLPADKLIESLVAFFSAFDPVQVRIGGAWFTKLVDVVTNSELFPPAVAVEALVTAILRLDPSGATFTSTHLNLANLAARENMAHSAFPVIDRDILFFPAASGKPKDKTSSTSRDLEFPSAVSLAHVTKPVKHSYILEYNFLCGQLYISARQWGKARRAFERAIAHPLRDKSVSKIMNDSYQRWLLVSLLEQGKAHPLPSTVASAASHTYSVLSRIYKDIADLFVTPDVAKLKKLIEVGAPTFQQDENTSLVAAVRKGYHEWQIVKLRDVYRHVSIASIRASILNAESGEAYSSDEELAHLIREMISAGTLKGRLDVGQSGQDTYISFGEDRPDRDEAAFASDIARAQKNIRELGAEYKKMNESLSATPEYRRFLVREDKRKEKEGIDGGVDVDGDVDEDLMTGIVSH